MSTSMGPPRGAPPKPIKRGNSRSPSDTINKKNKSELERYDYNQSSSEKNQEVKYMSCEYDSSESEILNDKLERKKLTRSGKNDKNILRDENSETTKKITQEMDLNQNKEVCYQSSDRGPFIIIMEQENISDVKTGKRLNELNIKNIVNIKQTGKNRVKVQLSDSATANRILKNPNLKTIDKYKCFIPSSTLLTTGIVKDISLDMSNEEILENSSCEFKILSVERMTKWDSELQQNLPSTNIKIVFRACKLPTNLKIFYAPRRVEYFIPKTILCKKCLVYGHTKNQCKNKNVELCRNCSEVNHNSDLECRQNCKFCKNENHKTGNYKCPEEEIQRKINKIKIIDKIPYKEARALVIKPYDRNFPALQNQNSQTKSYANTVANNENKLTEEIKKLKVVLNVIKEKINVIAQSSPLDPNLAGIYNILSKHVKIDNDINPTQNITINPSN